MISLTDEVESADDLMIMQLKVADSTTGLSDNKDIKKLTLVRHVVPRDFRALAELFANMAGVTELIFGYGARDNDARFVGPFPHADERRNGRQPSPTRYSGRDGSQLPGLVRRKAHSAVVDVVRELWVH